MNEDLKNILLLTALMLVLCLTALIISGDNKTQQLTQKEYTIRDGETLWSIAQQHKPDNMDIRAYIDKLYNTNEGLTADIKAGQKIIIFVAKEVAK